MARRLLPDSCTLHLTRKTWSAVLDLAQARAQPVADILSLLVTSGLRDERRLDGIRRSPAHRAARALNLEKGRQWVRDRKSTRSVAGSLEIASDAALVVDSQSTARPDNGPKSSEEVPDENDHDTRSHR